MSNTEPRTWSRLHLKRCSNSKNVRKNNLQSRDRKERPKRFSFVSKQFVIIAIAITIVWILIALWTRTIENFAFGTLGLSGSSTWHSFIVAIVVSLLFLLFVWIVDINRIIPGGLEDTVAAQSSGVTNPSP